jgi:ABC-2 type transport system ATP-binding protein
MVNGDKQPVSTNEVAIKVSGVSKSFKLPHEKNTSIKSIVTNPFKKRTFEKQEVLKDISFEIKKGEFFGIVGRNGSGKSTLLKLISGIYDVDNGSITTNGRLVPFIELGVGFNPELTGRENVFLNGALLGFNRKEMNALYDEIVEFAELEKFMDQKLKNYSSGMQVRLAFSVAIRAKADVLILDEVLAVGDEAFQRKCFSYFAQLKKAKKTVVLVTHGMDSVQRFCTRAMLLNKGEGLLIGDPLKIAQKYNEINNLSGSTVNQKKNETDNKTSYVKANVDYKNLENEIEFNVEITSIKTMEDPIVAFLINKENGEQVYRWVSDEDVSVSQINLMKGRVCNMKFTLQNIFPTGGYSVRVMVRKKDRTVDYGVFNEATTFDIYNNTPYEFNTLWKPKYSLDIKEENEKLQTD